MKPILLLDMDGVIADFFTAALDLYGVKWEHVLKKSSSQQLVYDVGLWIKAATFYKNDCDEKGLTKRINDKADFWINLERYSWASMLVELIEGSFGDNFYICSAPWLHDCHSQKICWIDQYFPKLRRRVILTDHKELLAKPNHILLDDCGKNIEKFREHGGRGIIFPQLWNEKFHLTSSYDKLSYVRTEILTMLEIP